MIIYLVVTVLAGCILSFFASTFKSTKQRGDGNPYFGVFLCFVATIAGPFVFVELLTKGFGDPMAPALKRALANSQVRGKFQYYKVTWYSGSEAKALVVAEERMKWGGTDRPVLGVDLVKKGSDWAPKAYSVIWSDRLNKDGLVMPPYR